MGKVKKRWNKDKERKQGGKRHLHASITLLVVCFNFMHGDVKDKDEAEGFWLSRVSLVQREALRCRHMSAEDLGFEKVEETFLEKPGKQSWIA